MHIRANSHSFHITFSICAQFFPRKIQNMWQQLMDCKVKVNALLPQLSHLDLPETDSKLRTTQNQDNEVIYCVLLSRVFHIPSLLHRIYEDWDFAWRSRDARPVFTKHECKKSSLTKSKLLEMLYKEAVLRIFVRLKEKNLERSSILSKTSGLRLYLN